MAPPKSSPKGGTFKQFDNLRFIHFVYSFYMCKFTAMQINSFIKQKTIPANGWDDKYFY